MKSSPSIAEVAKALSAAQGKMKAATMGSTNPHFKSKYASLTEIMDAIRAPFAVNGLAVVQGVEAQDDTGLTVTTTLLHTSGEWIESSVRVPVVGGNAQQVGSALTYARRYSLAALCGVVADEDDDGHAATQAPPPAKKDPVPARTKGTYKGKLFTEVPREELERALRKARDDDPKKYAAFIDDVTEYLAALDPESSQESNA